MKVAIIYNKDFNGVINRFGMQNKEVYNPKTVYRVFNALESSGHNVAIIDGNMHVIEQLHEFMPKVVDGERMGMVFNMAYGIQGESRYTHIPALLEMLGIPYVGSSPSGHAMALDKVITKIIMQQKGIPTPEFWVFNSEYEDLSEVKYPSIVKPKMESVSYGLRIVNNEIELRDAIKYIKEEFKQQVLVEKFIPGREFCVGLLGNDPVEAFPVLEIDLENNPYAIQTADDKKFAPKRKICPANIPKELADEMVRLSIKAFRALQLKDFSRVDIRLDENNNIYLLEINSMASLGESGSYVHAASAAGYSFDKLVNKMLDVAAVRYFSDKFLADSKPLNGNKQALHVKMRSYLRSRQESLEKLLQQMVNINSYVRNIEGINSLSDLVKKNLASLGFSYEIIPQVDVGNFLLFSNNSNSDYDILILGHLDNNIQISKQKYFIMNEQKMFGTGIWEHKSGLAMMIGALQALNFTRNLKKLNLGILLTTDNTLQGKFAKDIVKKISENAKMVIGLHGSSYDGGIVTSRSGAAVYHCEMGLINAKRADDVSFAMSIFSKVITKWTDLTDRDKGLIITPSEINMKSNIGEPFAHGEVTLSVRFNDIKQMEIIDERIRKAIPNRYKNQLNFQIQGGIRRPSMHLSDESRKIIEQVKEIARKMDIRLLEEHRWSSADICFVEKNLPLIDGIGPVGMKSQDNTEYILRHSFIEKTTLLAMILHEIGNSIK